MQAPILSFVHGKDFMSATLTTISRDNPDATKSTSEALTSQSYSFSLSSQITAVISSMPDKEIRAIGMKNNADNVVVVIVFLILKVVTLLLK
jgi:hypothetical protein